MSAATLTIGTIGRGIQFGNLSGILVTVTGVSTTYATASGGLPFDLVTILQNAAPAGWNAPNYTQAINVQDVVGLLPIQLSTAGYLPMQLVVAISSCTYSAVPWESNTGGPANTPGILTSAPTTLRLIGIGAAATNHAAFGETADGSNSDVVTFLLLVMRNGANN